MGYRGKGNQKEDNKPVIVFFIAYISIFVVLPLIFGIMTTKPWNFENCRKKCYVKYIDKHNNIDKTKKLCDFKCGLKFSD